MTKRTRQSARECPICYKSLTAATLTEVNPFQCDHVLCVACDTRMVDVSDHRCPVCRAPRIGMSREQAEPEPSRNQQPPSMEDLVAELTPVPDELRGLLREIAVRHGMLSGSTRGYGLPPGARPNTGHVLFFPVESPEEVGVAVIPRVAPDLLQELPDSAARTLASVNALPEAAINALINADQVPLQQWHEIVRQPRRQSARSTTRASSRSPRRRRNG